MIIGETHTTLIFGQRSGSLNLQVVCSIPDLHMTTKSLYCIDHIKIRCHFFDINIFQIFRISKKITEKLKAPKISHVEIFEFFWKFLEIQAHFWIFRRKDIVQHFSTMKYSFSLFEYVLFFVSIFFTIRLFYWRITIGFWTDRRFFAVYNQILRTEGFWTF